MDTLPLARSHASPIASWSTSPVRSGATPERRGGEVASRCGLDLVAVGGEGLEPVPQRGERPDLVAEPQRVRVGGLRELRDDRLPRCRSASTAGR